MIPRLLAALAAGLLFGLGLAVSGMMNPRRVLGFLDIAGHWDPTLVFVLAGAVSVSAVGYLVAGRIKRPWLAPSFDIPARRDIDARLIGGAVLFGIGWGLSGFCPGPALAALGAGLPGDILFAAAMLAGMWISARLERLPAGSIPFRAAGERDRRRRERGRQPPQ
jgi:uncharacterized membrane protein YedE/YeeE